MRGAPRKGGPPTWECAPPDRNITRFLFPRDNGPSYRKNVLHGFFVEADVRLVPLNRVITRLTRAVGLS